MNITELAIGDKCKVIKFMDDDLALLLNDLGVFVGEEIELSNVAPLGDPICIKTDDTMISIRNSDAKQIIVQKG